MREGMVKVMCFLCACYVCERMKLASGSELT